jgi:hypothetical protein
MACMSDQTLRRVIGIMATLLVVVVAAGALLVLTRGGSGRAGESPSGNNAAAASASAGPSSSASQTLTPTATPTGNETPPALSSPSPSASPLPAPLATLTFLNLKLDPTGTPGAPSGAPGAQARIVSFSSDGPGTVSAKLASHTTPGTTHMCLKVGAKVIGCNDIASGTFIGKTSQAHANWQVTLQGTGIAAPIVDLTVTFQSLAPAVKIQHARFNGTAFPDTNGIQARFTARDTGSAHLVANWGGHPFPYEIDLFDETSGTGNATLPNQGPSTSTDQTLPVVAGDWRLVLQNIEDGFGTTDLTATIGWP